MSNASRVYRDARILIRLFILSRSWSFRDNANRGNDRDIRRDTRRINFVSLKRPRIRGRGNKSIVNGERIANLIIVKVRDKSIPYNKVRGKRVRGSSLLNDLAAKEGRFIVAAIFFSRERSVSHPNCCRGIKDRRG